MHEETDPHIESARILL